MLSQHAVSLGGYACDARLKRSTAKKRSELSPASSVPASNTSHPAYANLLRRVCGSSSGSPNGSSTTTASRAIAAASRAVAAVSETGSASPPPSHFRHAVAAILVRLAARISISPVLSIAPRRLIEPATTGRDENTREIRRQFTTRLEGKIVPRSGVSLRSGATGGDERTWATKKFSVLASSTVRLPNH
jgi:hypothetical protein